MEPLGEMVLPTSKVKNCTLAYCFPRGGELLEDKQILMGM